MWAFTDNTDFKGLDTFVDRMHVKPPDFLRRLGYGFSDESRLSIQMWAALICDVIDLIDRSGLDVDMTEERTTCETLAGDAAQRNRGIGTALLAQACLVGKLAELFQLRAHSSGDHQAAHRVLMRAGFGIHPIDCKQE
jgi:GNAT superfamily N-acetyltransferase